MAKNIALMRQTLAAVEAHPEEWKQEHWRCKTGMCFAGWAAHLAGAQWETDEQPAYYANSLSPYRRKLMPAQVITPAGRRAFVGEYAAEVLGLDDDDDELLFNADNTLDDLRRLIDRYAAEAEAAEQIAAATKENA